MWPLHSSWFDIMWICRMCTEMVACIAVEAISILEKIHAKGWTIYLLLYCFHFLLLQLLGKRSQNQHCIAKFSDLNILFCEAMCMETWSLRTSCLGPPVHQMRRIDLGLGKCSFSGYHKLFPKCWPPSRLARNFSAVLDALCGSLLYFIFFLWIIFSQPQNGEIQIPGNT